MGFIRGRIHPPPKPTVPGQPKDLLFTVEESAKVFTRFLHVPVCLNHDNKIVIGVVNNLAYGDYGEIMVDMFINETNPVAVQVMKDIHNGKLRGLSVSYRTRMNTETFERIGDFEALEISVCESGALDKTRIQFFGYDNKEYVSESGFEEIESEGETTPRIAHTMPRSIKDLPPFISVAASKNNTFDTLTKAAHNAKVNNKRISFGEKIRRQELNEFVKKLRTFFDDEHAC